jgi:hypothetical protein
MVKLIIALLSIILVPLLSHTQPIQQIHRGAIPIYQELQPDGTKLLVMHYRTACIAWREDSESRLIRYLPSADCLKEAQRIIAQYKQQNNLL